MSDKDTIVELPDGTKVDTAKRMSSRQLVLAQYAQGVMPTTDTDAMICAAVFGVEVEADLSTATSDTPDPDEAQAPEKAEKATKTAEKPAKSAPSPTAASEATP